MTETQPEAEAQAAEPQSVTPEEPAAPTEPLYGVQDVQAALGESGQRAMAQSYFNTYTAQTGMLGMTQAQANEMVTTIQSGQQWSPPQVEPQGAAPEGGA